MTAVGGLALYDAEKLAAAADVIGALTLEALRGTPVAFDERIHVLRPHAGQQASAQRLRELLAGREIRESHRDKTTDPRVQDAYALRCMPQVHGAVRDALAHAPLAGIVSAFGMQRVVKHTGKQGAVPAPKTGEHTRPFSFQHCAVLNSTLSRTSRSSESFKQPSSRSFRGRQSLY